MMIYMLTTKTRGFAPQIQEADKNDKLAGVTQPKLPFAKNTVFTTPIVWKSSVNQRGRENKGPPDIAPKSFSLKKGQSGHFVLLLRKFHRIRRIQALHFARVSWPIPVSGPGGAHLQGVWGVMKMICWAGGNALGMQEVWNRVLEKVHGQKVGRAAEALKLDILVKV